MNNSIPMDSLVLRVGYDLEDTKDLQPYELAYWERKAVTVSKEKILALFPDSIISSALELNPDTKEIEFTHPSVTSGVISMLNYLTDRFPMGIMGPTFPRKRDDIWVFRYSR